MTQVSTSRLQRQLGSFGAVMMGLGALVAVLMAIMLAAIISTKIPILLGQRFWGLDLRDLSRYGFWSVAHPMRTDWAMLLGSFFLLLTGGARWSAGRYLSGRTA